MTLGEASGMPERSGSRSEMSRRPRKFDPPLLTEGPLTGCIYVVTVGRVRDGGIVESTTKYDVTDQFEALVAKRAARAAHEDGLRIAEANDA